MSVLIVCCRSWISCPENKADTTYHLVVVGGGGGHMLPFTRIALPHFQGETG